MKLKASLAVTLDGRITTPDGRRFASQADLARLARLRHWADAVILGGATFRAWPKPHPGRWPGKPDTLPLHVIVTRGQKLETDLPPEAPLFASEAGVLIATTSAVTATQKALYPTANWAQLSPTAPLAGQLVGLLAAAGCQRVLLEGGGHLVSAFLEQPVEWHLTLCPVLAGEAGTTPLVAGGLETVSQKMMLQAARPTADGELFLVYRAKVGA